MILLVMSMVVGFLLVTLATFIITSLGFPPMVYKYDFPRWALVWLAPVAVLSLFAAAAFYQLRMPQHGRRAVQVASASAALIVGAWGGTKLALKIQRLMYGEP